MSVEKTMLPDAVTANDKKNSDEYSSRLLRRAIASREEEGVANALAQGGRYAVHSRNEMGLSPLHLATLTGPPRIVGMLVDAGADLEATFEGLTSLHIACGQGYEGVVHVLLEEGANRDARTAQGFTALHCASGWGGLGSVKMLLKAGADANVRSNERQRRTPLHAAAVLGDTAVTEELLNWGARVDLPDSDGVTSLHIAAAVDNVEVAQCLLQAGASTEATQAGTLHTPLHLAAFQGSRKALAALLQAGANVSARNFNGESPLHHACMMLDVTIVEVLLGVGADEAARNNDNSTPAGVLGKGLNEQAGGGRGDPHLRQRISIMLARAPAERAWRRRAWLVMMRARHLNQPQEVIEGNERGQRKSVPWRASPSRAFCVGGRNGRCRSRGHGRQEESVVGACMCFRTHVSWAVEGQEEGIFREVVSFI